MRIMAVHALHRSVAIAVAVALRLLICERAHAAVGKERVVPQLRQAERVIVRQWLAGEIARREHVLERVTPIADLERRIFTERGERPHPDVGRATDVPRTRELDVPASGAVARLAVYAQRSESRVVPPQRGIEHGDDLTAMA